MEDVKCKTNNKSQRSWGEGKGRFPNYIEPLFYHSDSKIQP
jgi:hypothetical protein